MTQDTAAPAMPDDLSQLEAQAARVLSPEALAYILAGAGDADTTRAAAAAFRRWKIKRRKGRKPAKVDLSTPSLGTRMPRAGPLRASDPILVLPNRKPANIVHGVPSFAAFRRSVLINREGTPPSSSGPSTTSGYSSRARGDREPAQRGL